jgi:hypothetical protein
MSRSSRRLAFAAPFILVAATAAAPGCKHAADGGGDDDSTIHRNPPVHTHHAEWNVYKTGDTCQADNAIPDSCPPGASCNPPPPMTVACPAGMPESGSVYVYQDTADGPCMLGTDGSETPCPSWEEGE